MKLLTFFVEVMKSKRQVKGNLVTWYRFTFANKKGLSTRLPKLPWAPSQPFIHFLIKRDELSTRDIENMLGWRGDPVFSLVESPS